MRVSDITWNKYFLKTIVLFLFDVKHKGTFTNPRELSPNDGTVQVGGSYSVDCFFGSITLPIGWSNHGGPWRRGFLMSIVCCDSSMTTTFVQCSSVERTVGGSVFHHSWKKSQLMGG